MTKILVINGSYRDDGVTDQIVEVMVSSLKEENAEIEVITLRNYEIEFCLNCRECTQQSGVEPGQCVHHDKMSELVNKIEKADAYILASPTNFGSATAIFKRFMERLIVYAYWPWGVNSPKLRKAGVMRKKAALVSSCGAPGIMGRWLYGTHKQLKATAQIIGAETIGVIFTGLVSQEMHPPLAKKSVERAKSLAKKLL